MRETEGRRKRDTERERGGREGQDDCMVSPINGHEFEQAPRDGEGQEAWHAVVHGVAKSWTQLGD